MWKDIAEAVIAIELAEMQRPGVENS